MKKYIKPASNVIKMQMEDAILNNSLVEGTTDNTPIVDNDANIFSNDKGAWSSDNWSDDNAF